MERKKKLGKKQIWYEVQENESIEDCLARMRKDGFMVIGRKEEPLFQSAYAESNWPVGAVAPALAS